MIVDAQIHAWRRGDGGAKDPDGKGVEAEDLLAVMNESGVDAAVVVSANSIYDLDSSFAVETAARDPKRLRAVGPIRLDVDNPVGFFEEWAADERTSGLRLVLRGSGNADAILDPRHLAAFDAVERLAVPLCVWAPGEVALIEALARRHTGMQLVVDHTGVDASKPMTGRRLLSDGASVIALATLPNVKVKLTGVPALSAEPYPFRDCLPWVEEILAAFTPERVMWGTDWTRTRDVSSYAESLGWIAESGLLTGAERDAVMGLTAHRLFFR